MSDPVDGPPDALMSLKFTEVGKTHELFDCLWDLEYVVHFRRLETGSRRWWDEKDFSSESDSASDSEPKPDAC
ncbi:hypothetical protein O9K51_02165 [Purpureocillium lavendulum]|uniref:Uncharacterized protein n=1 Tax=Purpureocillium lavendulum TaxID=1247861 RepID=A0AB34FXZ1_9HYPO|nr:hypothetical protein O9K51_02165 [Purpureocillium lavendulum]